MTYEQMIFTIYVGVLAFVSTITFFAYINDKSRAIKGKERIKEKTLLALTAFGGGFGALVATCLVNHKTDKSYFSLIIFLSFLIQISVLVLIGLIAFKGVLL